MAKRKRKKRGGRDAGAEVDVVIIGGGPAGLSAALVLARCRRSVVVCDHGHPRNAAADKMHGYLTRDGVAPRRLLELGRREIESYGVQFHEGEVVTAKSSRRDGFTVVLHDGSVYRSRRLVLATGVRDQLPHIHGLPDFYGTSVHHCQYCDGYEWRDQRLAAYGVGKSAVGLALSLLDWSAEVVIVTDGRASRVSRWSDTLDTHGVEVIETKIKRLAGRGGKMRAIEFEDGSTLERDALFFNTGQRQRSKLAERLGCKFDGKGGVKVNKRQCTSVPGLYLAGDASHEMQFVICAAAQGATAAVAINHDFQNEAGRML
ncbi:MAG: NAD(P)/FAD-dependent oxidoreductase [Phycisphaerales bacterium]